MAIPPICWLIVVLRKGGGSALISRIRRVNGKTANFTTIGYSKALYLLFGIAPRIRKNPASGVRFKTDPYFAHRCFCRWGFLKNGFLT